MRRMGACSLILICDVICAGGCFFPPRPWSLRETRIVTGDTFLSRSVFFEHPDLKFAGALQVAEESSGHASKVAIFGRGTVWFVDPLTRRVQRVLKLEDHGYMSDPLLVDVDGDGVREIAMRGGGFSDVGLIDSTGKLLWKKSGSYATHSTANSMAVGDLNRDGAMEFYVAATDGLYSFAANGSRKWRVGGANDCYWRAELFDSRVASECQIVAKVQRRGRYQPQFLEFRDHQGNLLRRVKPAREVGAFRVLEWPIDGRPLRILSRYGSALTILDKDCHVVWEYKIPRKFGVGMHVNATFVRFSDEEDPYLAVLLGTRAGWSRSILCVFSLDGNLVYQEILDPIIGLLAVRLDGANVTGDVLLIGEGMKRKVVAYQRRVITE